MTGRGRRRVALIAQYDGVESHGDGPLLLDALARAGIAGEILPWGASRDWSAYDLVVVRNTWDYLDRRDEFLGWARRVERESVLANPSAVLEWNSDKRYLRDLAEAGVATVPTRWLDPHGDPAGALADLPWDDVVVKPSVSAGSRSTARYRRDDRRALEHAGALAAEGHTVMIQPYVSDVDVHGESGTYVFGGRPSHAVRKGAVLEQGAPPPTDFSLAIAQDASRQALAPELAAFAEEVLRTARPWTGDLLYARVDAVRADDGSLVLLELELIEPFLFLDTDPPAADRFAAAVIDVLDRG